MPGRAGGAARTQVEVADVGVAVVLALGLARAGREVEAGIGDRVEPGQGLGVRAQGQQELFGAVRLGGDGGMAGFGGGGGGRLGGEGGARHQVEKLHGKQQGKQ